MKNQTLKPALLALAIGAAFAAAPVVALAQSASTDPATSAPVRPDNRLTTNISGHVTAKTDNTVTVDNRTVSTTGATTYSKSGASIGSGDVKVGDTVNIVTTENGQVAVSVNVLVSS